ncbi:MAG: SET domain-containing protein-lysine N-methyltransferase [Planctomycetaceae bacterium]|jgi:hypothetical protein|nr:SET domain-containing protein-lysine N-methyltransferase [Planctomycetaceae bacterium]
MENRVNVILPSRSLSDCGRVFPCGVRIGETAYGLGVFAYAFIPKGTPIARVPGKIVIDPDYGSDYCINAGENKVLEPAPPFCYLNHACDPNCLLTQYVREGNEINGEELEEGNLETSDLEPDDEDEIALDDDMLGDDDECFFGDGGAKEIESESESDIEAEDNNYNANVANSAISVTKNCSKNLVDKADEDDAEIEPEFEDDVDSEIWVEALRDILPGEQLTIDYAWPAERAIKCQCGCKNCRGWIVTANELNLVNNSK